LNETKFRAHTPYKLLNRFCCRHKYITSLRPQESRWAKYGWNRFSRYAAV